MDYPLHMHNKAAGGYAVANDEDEHRSLSDAGYEPKLEASGGADDDGETKESLQAKLDAAGIAYKKTWGVDRLKAALAGE